uniref:Uncharacterized protein n=1 Tax=Siphoviridae sp. cttFh17 TaxID=2826491 RepID=A0A8S5NJG7_9CAUD|nr:MAG TPA: hypothetical protein [Siphoviridae sp. cttFh17]
MGIPVTKRNSIFIYIIHNLLFFIEIAQSKLPIGLLFLPFCIIKSLIFLVFATTVRKY